MAAKTEAVTGTFRPFAGSYMAECTLRIVALSKLEPEEAFWHTVGVVLVQEIALLALHAQVPEPVFADDAVATPRSRTLRRRVTICLQTCPPQDVFGIYLCLEVK
eukprot:CAMPEP_0171138624 /NCGR_PEP_ID=MMETSP0766_2-20121228/135373_1 /TAXON_ID=439317 /ORGANISM="Gambierdiscus australes, Strain CAWD 149" /LENGTH=104 /DNA_ID=CAMNT_0011602241 /DNA_START=114 /DNA_END=428 /DNA_ORIENTATION=-